MSEESDSGKDWIGLSEVDVSLDPETVVRLQEALPDEEELEALVEARLRLEEAVLDEGVVDEMLEVKLEMARTLGALGDALGAERALDLMEVVRGLEGVDLRLEGVSVPDVESYEYDGPVYRGLEAEIERGGYDLDVETCYRELVERGLIVVCAGCGREELEWNDHRYAVVDGELLCGRCREAGRGVQ